MSVSAVQSTPSPSSIDLTISVQVQVVQVYAAEPPSISQGASLLSRLEELQKSDPGKFQAVLTKVADELHGEAQQASGDRAVLIGAIADRFAAAAQAGNLSPLQESPAPAAAGPSSPSSTAAAASGAPSTASQQAATGAAPPVPGHHHPHHRHRRAHGAYAQDSSAGAWPARGLVSHVAALVEAALQSVLDEPASSPASPPAQAAAPA